jgi:hypothetical protein
MDLSLVDVPCCVIDEQNICQRQTGDYSSCFLCARKYADREKGYLPRFTAFFKSVPAANFVTRFAEIFKGWPVWGFRPVRALREPTEKVPNPTRVTLPPRFNVETTPSSVEFSALPAWTFESLASFAILSINSPLFMLLFPFCVIG